jgi:hypothetical protein
MLSSSAKSEGGLSRSADGHYVTLGGYGPTVDAQLVDVKGSAADRIAVRINAAGTVETSKLSASAFVADNLRTVTSTDGTDLWAGGAGTTNSGGVWYAAFGSSTATGAQIIGTAKTGLGAPADVRTCAINAMILYCSSDNSSYAGVFSIGSGNAPKAGPQSSGLLAGFPTGKGNVSYSFIFAASDRLYIADDRAPSAGGGVQKWTKTGDTWSLAFTFNTGTFGTRGMTALVSGNNVTIFASTADTDGTNDGLANTIVKISDTLDRTDYSTSPPTSSVLVSAPANTFFRGLALPPQ